MQMYARATYANYNNLETDIKSGCSQEKYLINLQVAKWDFHSWLVRLSLAPLIDLPPIKKAQLCLRLKKHRYLTCAHMSSYRRALTSENTFYLLKTSLLIKPLIQYFVNVSMSRALQLLCLVK
ncbi:hypothetical protein XENOCAPTIV_007595 [Xenoophorus captivus]|uniref:Uncharacterized protein n=1 Tax=Xenoophorus captivus TaxID=1517983 RepID=A0ABV0RTQ6_9TELE